MIYIYVYNNLIYGKCLGNEDSCRMALFVFIIPSTPQGRCLRMSLAANTSLGSAGTGRAWWGLVNGWPHLNREQKMKSAVQNYIYVSIYIDITIYMVNTDAVGPCLDISSPILVPRNGTSPDIEKARLFHHGPMM